MEQQSREALIAWALGEDAPKTAKPQDMPAPEPAPVPATAHPGDCPRCGEVMRHIGAPGKRCQACGYQPRVNQAAGISRAEIDDYEGGRANFQPRGFAMALARLGIGIRR